jgi:hypothetical protein
MRFPPFTFSLKTGEICCTHPDHSHSVTSTNDEHEQGKRNTWSIHLGWLEMNSEGWSDACALPCIQKDAGLPLKPSFLAKLLLNRPAVRHHGILDRSRKLLKLSLSEERPREYG